MISSANLINNKDIESITNLLQELPLQEKREVILRFLEIFRCDNCNGMIFSSNFKRCDRCHGEFCQYCYVMEGTECKECQKFICLYCQIMDNKFFKSGDPCYKCKGSLR